MYEQRYESAGAFWPHLQMRIIACVIIQQICLIGVLATKSAKNSTPILLFLPVLTIAFHIYCKNRFEPAFRKYPLEDAMAKDTLERATDPNFNIESYLLNTYMHPVFKTGEDEEYGTGGGDWTDNPPLVPTKRASRNHTPASSLNSDSPML